MKATKFFTSALFLALFVSMFGSAEENFRVGVVNFGSCLEKSYLGRDGKAKLDSRQNEIVAILESKEKEFKEVAEKLNDSDYIDTISEEAEGELTAKAKELSEELQHMHNQANYTLQQESTQMQQNLKAEIDKACEYIAREKDFDFILAKESCFYFKKPTDITPLVIKELNRHYQPEASEDSEKTE